MVKIHNMTKQHLQRLKVRVLRLIGLPVVFFLSAKVLDARDSVFRPRSLNMFNPFTPVRANETYRFYSV